jgi:hypothetical protein
MLTVSMTLYSVFLLWLFFYIELKFESKVFRNNYLLKMGYFFIVELMGGVL